MMMLSAMAELSDVEALSRTDCMIGGCRFTSSMTVIVVSSTVVRFEIMVANDVNPDGLIAMMNHQHPSRDDGKHYEHSHRRFSAVFVL